MKAHDFARDTAILALVIGAADNAPPQSAPDPGRWRSPHRRLRERLAALAVICAPYLLEGNTGHGSYE
jgi:hypothetical protein